jgi:hypothetical protein
MRKVRCREGINNQLDMHKTNYKFNYPLDMGGIRG